MKHRGAPRCQLLVSSPARGATARQLLVSSALLSTTAPLHNVFPSGRLYNRPNNRPSPHSISAGRLYQCEFKRGRERYKPLLYSHCHNRPAEIECGEGRLLGRLYNRPGGNTLWRGAVVLSSAEDTRSRRATARQGGGQGERRGEELVSFEHDKEGCGSTAKYQILRSRK